MENETSPALPEPILNFHQHLDHCGRCRNQPFNLCAAGDRLLRAAALGEELNESDQSPA